MQLKNWERIASRYGAAYPGSEILPPGPFVASLVAMLNLVRKRRFGQPPKGLRSIVEAVSGLGVSVPLVFRFPSLASEALWTAERINTWAVWLYAKAMNLHEGNRENAHKQFLAWWGQVAESLWHAIETSIPEAERDDLAPMVEGTIRELELAASTPVLSVGAAGLVGGDGEAGIGVARGGPGKGGGPGGAERSWSDRAISGAKTGAGVGSLGGPTAALYGALIGAGAGALGLDVDNITTEQVGQVVNKGLEMYQSWQSSTGKSDPEQFSQEMRPYLKGKNGSGE